MKLLLFFFVGSLGFLSVQGYEVCEWNNGTAEYCPDYGSSIGYCCEGFIRTLCCHYTPVYYMWYFWTPLVLIIFFATLCACACKLCASCCKSSASTHSSHHSLSGVERQAVITTTTTGVLYQGNTQHVEVTNDHLPSYAEIQQSQMTTMESYQQPQQEKPPRSRSSSSSSSSSNDDEAK